MPRFGYRSRKQLATAHPDLQLIAHRVIQVFDFSVLEGLRPTERQKELYRAGKSKLDGVRRRSKHQRKQDGTSHAIDVAPWPMDFSDDEKARARFYMLAGHFAQAAHDLWSTGQIQNKLRFGLDWDSDRDFKDQTFDDCAHIEIK